MTFIDDGYDYNKFCAMFMDRTFDSIDQAYEEIIPQLQRVCAYILTLYRNKYIFKHYVNNEFYTSSYHNVFTIQINGINPRTIIISELFPLTKRYNAATYSLTPTSNNIFNHTRLNYIKWRANPCPNTNLLHMLNTIFRISNKLDRQFIIDWLAELLFTDRRSSIIPVFIASSITFAIRIPYILKKVMWPHTGYLHIRHPHINFWARLYISEVNSHEDAALWNDNQLKILHAPTTRIAIGGKVHVIKNVSSYIIDSHVEIDEEDLNPDKYRIINESNHEEYMIDTYEWGPALLYFLKTECSPGII